MTERFHFFLSQPLWLTIPLVTVYFAILGYIVYTLWLYRKR